MKIAIIGAGTCGLYLAWKLSEKGHSVDVFEKKEKIGNEVCSGLFSQRILEFIPQSKNLIENEINSALIYFPKKKVKLDFSKKFFVMNHFQLDKLLGSLAEKAGAKIILSQEIKDLPQKYDRIIGCDGANSFVRKSLKLVCPFFRLGILGIINKENRENFVETWPCRNGFIWKIPRGEKTEYGIMAEPDSVLKFFQDFLKENNVSIENTKAKIIPQGLIIPSNSKITLCGDAAGMTKPWSGGGVIWGLSAADILLKTFPDFVKYRNKAKRFFTPKIVLAKTAVKIAYFLGFKIPWLLPKKIKIESDFLF